MFNSSRPSVRWGIIGAGQIAARFAADLELVENAELVGVASRSFEKIQNLALEFSCFAHPSIESLLSSELDVIYVATPHSLHKDHALAAIRAGKAVLCEKPFAMNRGEATEIIQEAKKNSVFLMEAMWTRFVPAVRDIVTLIQSGEIGEVRNIASNFGYAFPFDPLSRVYDPKLGGGSLLDVGVYCVSFAQMLIQNQPVEMKSQVHLGRTGVDENARWHLKYVNGVHATGHSSVIQDTNHEALVEGTKGIIRIPKFWCPREYHVNDQLVRSDFQGGGFQFEAQEVTDCLLRGELESKIMPLQDTLDVMETIDMIRERWGS